MASQKLQKQRFFKLYMQGTTGIDVAQVEKNSFSSVKILCVPQALSEQKSS